MLRGRAAPAAASADGSGACRELDALSLQATAAVVDAPRSADGRVPLQLLALLCRPPLRRFTAATMRTATFAWHWLAATQPHMVDALLAQMLPVWQATVLQQRGLFAGRWARVDPPLTPGDLAGWDADAADQVRQRQVPCSAVWWPTHC